MQFPKDVRYTRNDEWIRIDGGRARIGITDYAQDQLSDIVFFESALPVGEAAEKGASCATVESVKAAAEVYLPVSGKVTAVNEALSDTPETINSDPFGAGWMLEIELKDPAQADALLDSAAYEAYCKERAT